MSAASANQLQFSRWIRGSCRHELLDKFLGCFHCIELPGILLKRNVILSNLSLPARQVGKHAREHDLNEASRIPVPLEFSVEVGRQLIAALVLIHTGVLVYLCRQDSAISTNHRPSSVKPLQLEKLDGMNSGDFVIHIDIRDLAAVGVIDRHECL